MLQALENALTKSPSKLASKLHNRRNPSNFINMLNLSFGLMVFNVSGFLAKDRHDFRNERKEK